MEGHEDVRRVRDGWDGHFVGHAEDGQVLAAAIAREGADSDEEGLKVGAGIHVPSGRRRRDGSGKNGDGAGKNARLQALLKKAKGADAGDVDDHVDDDGRDDSRPVVVSGVDTDCNGGDVDDEGGRRARRDGGIDEAAEGLGVECLGCGDAGLVNSDGLCRECGGWGRGASKAGDGGGEWGGREGTGEAGGGGAEENDRDAMLAKLMNGDFSSLNLGGVTTSPSPRPGLLYS